MGLAKASRGGGAGGGRIMGKWHPDPRSPMVSNQQLIYPLFAMFALTFLVTLRNLQARIGALRRGEVNPGYFKLFQGEAPPEDMQKAQNNLRNLTELPVLFYAGVLAVMILQRADPAFLWLAWTYVGFRLLHSLVHLGGNNVRVRLAFFALSNLVLAALWIKLLIPADPLEH